MDQEAPQAHVLALIISQLKQYGLYSAAKLVAESSSQSYDYEPSSKLAFLCQKEDLLTTTENVETEYLTFEETSVPKSAPTYSTWFSTQHRLGCTTAAFSPDGQFFATGSEDASLKIVDVGRISSTQDDEKKVIRTLYDHSARVNQVQYHPNGLALASCSDDMQIKLYDMSKHHMKRGFRFLSDSHPVRSISFHPSGDFILSGTDHPAIRVFDVHTMKCYIPTTEHHQASINKVTYARSGSIFSSCSKDGSIKIYDTVSGNCVNTIIGAHGGQNVTCINFSKSSLYLLSTGLDSIGRLWDMRTGRVLSTFQGVRQSSSQSSMVFVGNEGYVIGQDDDTNSTVIWDTQTGALLSKLNAHSKGIECIAPSPNNMGFVTCGLDAKAKYWNLQE